MIEGIQKGGVGVIPLDPARKGVHFGRLDLDAVRIRKRDVRAKGTKGGNGELQIRSALKGWEDLYDRTLTQMHERKDQSRDELTADIASHAITARLQFSAYRDALFRFGKGKSPLAAKRLVHVKRSLQKSFTCIELYG